MKAGDLLAGKYRVQAVLGQGAMGVVVAAIHEELGQKVALKFLLPDALKSEDAVARFTREARAMVKIHSEHIARVIDVGRLEDGAPYTVMEFLQGRDLGALLEEQGALAVGVAVDYVLQACEAVAEAHSNGIIHRDLKPSNLFLTKRADGSALVKVLDFGIAKSLDDAGAVGSQTNAGTLLGSPYYMSPEQMRSSHNVDLRSDIWALGIILFELLTGRPVFVADTMPGLCGAILADAPTPLRTLRSGAPEGLEVAILKCLERELPQRFQNVAELAQALLPFAPKGSRVSVERISRLFGAAPLPDSLPPPPQVVAAPTTGARTTGPWAETQSVPAPSRRLGMMGLAATGVAALAIGALLLLRHKEPAPDATSRAEAHTSAAVSPAAVAPPPAAPPPAAEPTGPVQPEVLPALTADKAAPAPAASVTAAAPKARTSARPRTPVAKVAAAVKPSQGGAVDPLDGRK